jgi:hypothetical protein
MATSITHEDIKPIVGVATATTSYDTEFDTICTMAGSTVDAYSDSGAPANVLKQAAIYIAAGGALIYLASLPGRSEAVTAGGVALSESVQSPVGDKLIALGFELLKPFNVIDYDASAAEAAYKVALAQARDDYVADVAVAEKNKIVGDAAMASGLAADANARAGVNVQRLADMVALNASLADVTELPISNTTDSSLVFALDAEGYD